MLGRKRKAAATPSSEHTLIAKSSTITGDIEFGGVLHVQGYVKGQITVSNDQGQLVIDKDGRVEGEIHVPHIIINGHVIGDVYATEKLELAENARIEGNVTYETIEMMAGAQVNGKLVRNREQQKSLPAPEKQQEEQEVEEAIAEAKA